MLNPAVPQCSGALVLRCSGAAVLWLGIDGCTGTGAPISLPLRCFLPSRVDDDLFGVKRVAFYVNPLSR